MTATATRQTDADRMTRCSLAMVPDVPVDEALELMDRHHVDAVAVCTHSGLLLGIAHRAELRPLVRTDTVIGMLRHRIAGVAPGTRLADVARRAVPVVTHGRPAGVVVEPDCRD